MQVCFICKKKKNEIKFSLIRNGEYNCSCKFHSCLSVLSSLTAAAATVAAGNINEKHITSFTPDDIFLETPTQVAEKRFPE